MKEERGYLSAKPLPNDARRSNEVMSERPDMLEMTMRSNSTDDGLAFGLGRNGRNIYVQTVCIYRGAIDII